MYYISADLCEKAVGRGSREWPFPKGRVGGETGRRPPAAPGGGRAGGARAGGACGTAGPAARVPAPCRNFPRGRPPHTQARKKRGALRLPCKCDQILMPSSAILSRSERKSAKPFWVLAGLRSSAAGWKVPIIQTPFFSTHSPCWRVTL